MQIFNSRIIIYYEGFEFFSGKIRVKKTEVTRVQEALWFQMSLFMSSFRDPCEALQSYLSPALLISDAGSARVILPTCVRIRAGTNGSLV